MAAKPREPSDALEGELYEMAETHQYQPSNSGIDLEPRAEVIGEGEHKLLKSVIIIIRADVDQGPQ